jgi:hypothetical protein
VNNEKRGTFNFDRSRFDLQTNRFRPYPVKGLKRTLFLSFEVPNNGIASEVYKNPGNMQATCSIQTTLFILCRQSIHRSDLSRYLKRFMMEGPGGANFLPSSLLSAKMYNTDVSVKGYYVSTVSQPDTMQLLGNSNCFQMTKTGFAEWF